MIKTKYTAKEILNKYDEQLEEAEKKLKELTVYCGDKIKINGLNGWVFEQVVQHHLTEELIDLGIKNPSELMMPQFPLTYELEEKKKHPKIDLKIGNKILIEIKGQGYLYSASDQKKYEEIRKKVNEQDSEFLYITKKDGGVRYRNAAKGTFGEENCFFLDDKNEDNWQKFVERVYELLPEEIKSITRNENPITI